MSRWLVLVSSVAVAIMMMSIGPAGAEQPALTPPTNPADTPAAAPATQPPAAAPAMPPGTPATPAPAPVRPVPAAGPATYPPAPAPATQPDVRSWSAPPTTSEYPPMPPVSGYRGGAQALPRGTAAPGATSPVLPALAPQTRTERYPLVIMLADVAWFLGGWRLESPGLLVGGYVGAAPLAHALMGNTRSALISGGLRAGVVALIAATTVHAIESDCGDCEAQLGVLYVGLLGAAAVMGADWLVLAKKEVPVAGAVQPDRAPDWVVTPQVQARDGGLQLGVGGWF